MELRFRLHEAVCIALLVIGVVVAVEHFGKRGAGIDPAAPVVLPVNP